MVVGLAVFRRGFLFLLECFRVFFRPFDWYLLRNGQKRWRRIKGYARTTSVQACCGSLHAAIVKRGLHNSTEWEVSRYLPRRPAGVAESRSLVLSHVAPACAVYLFFASLVDGRGCFGGVVRNLRLTKQTITGERNRVL